MINLRLVTFRLLVVSFKNFDINLLFLLKTLLIWNFSASCVDPSWWIRKCFYRNSSMMVYGFSWLYGSYVQNQIWTGDTRILSAFWSSRFHGGLSWLQLNNYYDFLLQLPKDSYLTSKSKLSSNEVAYSSLVYTSRQHCTHQIQFRDNIIFDRTHT